MSPSVVKSLTTYLFKEPPSKVINLAVGPSLTPIYSANLYPNPEETAETEKTRSSDWLFLANSLKTFSSSVSEPSLNKIKHFFYPPKIQLAAS